jgi:hypothetical protein
MALLETRRHVTPWIFDLRDQVRTWQGTQGPVAPLRTEARFAVVASVDAAGNRAPLANPVDLLTVRTPSGYFVWHSLARIGEGPAVRGLLRPGRYFVLVRAPRYSDLEIALDLPLPAPVVGPHRMAPGADYEFPGADPLRPGQVEQEGTGPTLLRGTLRREDGSGWGDVRVEAQGFARADASAPRTDGAGAWLIAFRDAATGDVTLRFTVPDGTTHDVGQVRVVRGRSASHVQTGLRGLVLSPAGTAAADASIVASTPAGTFRSRALRDGSFSLFFPPDVHASAPVRVALTVDWAGQAPLNRNPVVQPRAVTTLQEFRFP